MSSDGAPASPALEVQSFDTQAGRPSRSGTVLGHDHHPQELVDEIETAAFTCQCGTLGCSAHTACGQASCTCPDPGPSGFVSCGLTYCNETRDLCYSLITDSPPRC